MLRALAASCVISRGKPKVSYSKKASAPATMAGLLAEAFVRMSCKPHARMSWSYEKWCSGISVIQGQDWMIWPSAYMEQSSEWWSKRVRVQTCFSTVKAWQICRQKQFIAYPQMPMERRRIMKVAGHATIWKEVADACTTFIDVQHQPELYM